MSLITTLIFIVGYLFITIEHSLKINKAAIALLTGVLCWVSYVFSGVESHLLNEQLFEHFGEISAILFFLIGAMTVVEHIDAHNGFEVITDAVTTTSKRKLIWIICLLAFFLSAVLDNLTTTIVLVSLIRKLISDKNDKKLFLGMIVIAANAGGAWSPIGDVTTTMLWIGGQITTNNIISSLFLPSMVCILVPLIIFTFSIKGNISRPEKAPENGEIQNSKIEKRAIFFLGIAVLLFVPFFKTITHLPPFMGMLFGLGILWVTSEVIHRKKDENDKKNYTITSALEKIDVPSVLFFLGILIAISALQSMRQLNQLSIYMDEKIGDINLIVLTIGVLSSIVDNVPLVAAAMGMYDLIKFPTDSYFWEFLAYCAGTGGSILIIGSAAGVAAMGMEKINFFWYIKKISWLALIGYFSGALLFIALNSR